MQIGAHVSVAGGYHRGLEYGASIGAECIQIFAKSPRQWQARPIDPAAASAFVDQKRTMGFGPVFTHTAYLLNLSTADPLLAERTKAALADELVRGAMLGADGVVTHIGTAADGDLAAAAGRASAVILSAYEMAGEQESARLLLENTAGGGSTFGCTFEQIAHVIDECGLPPSRLGVCLDTCHAFAFGMPLDCEEGWREVVEEIAGTLSLERMGLIHANDCLYERGSRRDRHAWIGEGFIGAQGFTAMMCCNELDHVPVVCEMPGEVPLKDEVNLGRLKELRAACAPSH